jgi:hypothetical protein
MRVRANKKKVHREVLVSFEALEAKALSKIAGKSFFVYVCVCRWNLEM